LNDYSPKITDYFCKCDDSGETEMCPERASGYDAAASSGISPIAGDDETYGSKEVTSNSFGAVQ
jgi:hypothetical protein